MLVKETSKSFSFKVKRLQKLGETKEQKEH